MDMNIPREWLIRVSGMAEQQAYEDRLDEAMNRAQAEKGAKAES